MSESDDTDELLLVPPHVDDQKIVETYSIPYYQIVDKLITQVAKLKNRVESIENSTDNISLGSNSIDALVNMKSSDSCRRCFSYESLPNNQFNDYKCSQNNGGLPQCFSTQSTPQKPRSKLMLKSFPNSPKNDENCKIFKKPMHRAGVPKTTQNNTQHQSMLVENSLIKEIDDFLLNVKPTTKPEVARTLFFNTKSNNTEKQSQTVVDIQQILKEMEVQEEKLKNSDQTSKSEEDKWKKNVELSMSSTEDSSITDKSTVLCRPECETVKKTEEKPFLSYESSTFESCISCPHKNDENRTRINLGRVSLVNLWSKKEEDSHKDSEQFVQKLQEEKLRRTHCEDLIRQLQNKILEQQEKIAVAIQVDEAKDNAIIRFHDAWEKATNKFKQVVKERDQLATEIEKLNEKNAKTIQETDERIDFHRKETNEALNMVRDHQKKIEQLTAQLNEITSENESLKLKNQELETKLCDVEEKNKQLSKILADKEIEFSESKNILFHAKSEMNQCRAAVEMCQKDFSTIKAEYDLIQEELKSERNNFSQLHEQNKILHDELESYRKKEKSLLETLKSVQEKLETNKKELRNFYQGQVELLVQTKLKEFQKQLDEAETKMKDELNKKELEIAKSAALHIQQINDKYTLEINLLEQKHEEEIQLKQVKNAELEQKLHELQTKFDKHNERRSEIVRQLQRVMETQWNEAIRIINNGKSSPMVTTCEESSSTIDQLHSLQSKSYQNMEALLNFELNQSNENDMTNFVLKNQQSKQATSRKNPNFKDTESIQKYMNMLLNNKPSETNNAAKFQDETEKNWQHSEQHNQNYRESGNGAQHENVRKKNPWK